MRTATAYVLSIIDIVVCAVPSVAEAQQSRKLQKIGWLQNYQPTHPVYEGFRQGLRELGYVDGQNVVIEARAVVYR